MTQLEDSVVGALEHVGEAVGESAIVGEVGTIRSAQKSSYSLWGSNPRPMAHKTIALTTELRELLCGS